VLILKNVKYCHSIKICHLHLLPRTPPWGLIHPAIWKFVLTLWHRQNKELHGDDGAPSLKAKRKEALTWVTTVYRDTIGQVLPSNSSLILNWTRVTNIVLNWSKQHLDAYLATAVMACDWNVEPG
jgi:hypothetical protein